MPEQVTGIVSEVMLGHGFLLLMLNDDLKYGREQPEEIASNTKGEPEEPADEDATRRSTMGTKNPVVARDRRCEETKSETRR